MAEFKVGDMVRGKASSPYAITDGDMTKAEVVGVYSDGMIGIYVLEHNNYNDLKGSHEYSVDSEHFELVDADEVEDAEESKAMDVKVGDKVRWELTDMTYNVLFIKDTYVVLESVTTGSIFNTEIDELKPLSNFEQVSTVKAIEIAIGGDILYYAKDTDDTKRPFSKFTDFEDMGAVDLYDLNAGIKFYVRVNN